MGLFDSLLGNVSRQPFRKATGYETAAYGAAAPQLTGQVQQATGTLTGQAIPALQGAEQQAAGTLQGALPQSLSYLQGGYGQAAGDINKALGLYGPLAGITGGAEQMYANALGLGGAGGTQAALGAFQQGPGYQYQLQQGLDALQREANSRGMLASGNLTQDELAYSQNLANQGWQNWLGQLGGLGAQNQGVLGAQAGLYGQLANQGIGLGQQQAGLTQGTAQQVAGLQSGLGSNLANIYGDISGMQQGLGPELAFLTLGKGQAQAGGVRDYFNAQQQANANALDFWGNLLGGITSGAGRYFGSSGGAQPTALA